MPPSSPSLHSWIRWFVLLAAGLALVSQIDFSAFRQSGRHPPPPSIPSVPPPSGSQEAVADDTASMGIDDRLAQVFACSSTAARQSALHSLARALKREPVPAAVTWILDQIHRGRDLALETDLVIESDRSLSSWTSLRVFLLDTLFALDPAEARLPSLDVLAKSRSPDEWALALRNLSLGPGAGQDLALVKERTAQLIANPQWQETPSSGFLEAFDLAVHCRQVELVPLLLDVCARPDRRATRHAAHLALDRLVQLEPHAALSAVASAPPQPSLGPMTANLMARADVRDPDQRSLLEHYLTDPRRTPEEIRVFSNVFPNANYAVSRNLVTPPLVDPPTDRPERDASALLVVQEWLHDPRFRTLHQPLAETRHRLQGFLGQ